MDKKEVAAILEEMGTLLELQGANPFKARAYHNASRVIEGITDDLESLVSSGGIGEVEGIGKTIAEVVSDLVRTGRSHHYDDVRKDVPDGVFDILRIPGLGPKKVRVILDRLHITDLDGLERAAREDRLSTLQGFGKKTQENILRGIEGLRKRGERVLYPKALDAAERVFGAIVKVKGVLRGEIAGSLRRKKEVIGDIDLVVSAKAADRERILDAFVGHADVNAIVARGETKASVLLKTGINSDLRVVSDEEFPFALNYFTGSKEHNVEMRSRARERGWTLNEYGFSRLEATEKRGRVKRLVRCRDEADIYKALSLAYVPPELRENMGEFEAAEKGTLPELVQCDDLRGTFHCHTTYSDGANTIEQMAAAARTLGWQYIGIADHSKSAAYAGGLSERKLREQMREIDRLNEKAAGCHILKGTEADILGNGELDWPDAVLRDLDFVVASIHSGFNMSAAEMTRRVIKALTHKHVHILGHPTGRLLLSREGYPINMVEVINAAADHGKIIELNAHPTRLDLDWRLCKYAKEKGVLIAINPDAHTADGLQDVRYGIGIARKGWLTAADILNTRPLKEIGECLGR